jgi:hypothetical protein
MFASTWKCFVKALDGRKFTPLCSFWRRQSQKNFVATLHTFFINNIKHNTYLPVIATPLSISLLTRSGEAGRTLGRRDHQIACWRRLPLKLAATVLKIK